MKKKSTWALYFCDVATEDNRLVISRVIYNNSGIIQGSTVKKVLPKCFVWDSLYCIRQTTGWCTQKEMYKNLFNMNNEQLEILLTMCKLGQSTHDNI